MKEMFAMYLLGVLFGAIIEPLIKDISYLPARYLFCHFDYIVIPRDKQSCSVERLKRDYGPDIDVRWALVSGTWVCGITAINWSGLNQIYLVDDCELYITLHGRIKKWLTKH